MHNIGVSFRLFSCLFRLCFTLGVCFIASPTFVPNHMTPFTINIFALYPTFFEETATLPFATIFATMFYKLMPLNPVVLISAICTPVLCFVFFNTRFSGFPIFSSHSIINHLACKGVTLVHLPQHWTDLPNSRNDLISVTQFVSFYASPLLLGRHW